MHGNKGQPLTYYRYVIKHVIAYKHFMYEKREFKPLPY